MSPLDTLTLAPLRPSGIAVGMRRTADKIRKLCADLHIAKDEVEQAQILVKLRITLHEYVERLRAHLAAYPFVLERRVRRTDDRRAAPLR